MGVERMKRREKGEEVYIADFGFKDDDQDLVEGRRCDGERVAQRRAAERNATNKLSGCGVTLTS